MFLTNLKIVDMFLEQKVRTGKIVDMFLTAILRTGTKNDYLFHFLEPRRDGMPLAAPVEGLVSVPYEPKDADFLIQRENEMIENEAIIETEVAEASLPKRSFA